MEREALLEKILDRYASWYDISRLDDAEAPLRATAYYHSHDTSYMISRKAEMWSLDRFEYDYFFSVPELTPEIYKACYDRAFAMGEALIHPDKGHMSSSIVIVFLCDRVNDDAAQLVKNCRYRKSFQFSLKGWMEVQTVAVDLEEATVCANPAGRNTQKYFHLLLHPKKKRVLGIFRHH